MPIQLPNETVRLSAGARDLAHAAEPAAVKIRREPDATAGAGKPLDSLAELKFLQVRVLISVLHR